MTENSEDTFQQIAELKSELDQLRPLCPESVKSLREAIALEWTWH